MSSYQTIGPNGEIHQFNSTRPYTHALWWNRPEHRADPVFDTLRQATA